MNTPTGDSVSEPYSKIRQTAVIATLALAGLSAAFSQTVLIPIQGALPDLLGAPASQTAWVITVTLLASAIFTPIAGRLGDMYGKRRVSLVLMVFLIVGSLLASIADTLTPLLVGRAFQGLSMGVIPLGMSLLRDVVDKKRLGTAIAIVSATLGVGGAIGLPLSAVVTEYYNWHMLFVFSAGLAALVMLCIFFVVPSTKTRAYGRVDIPGVIGLTIGLVGVLLSISRGNDWGWTSTETLAGFIIGGVSLLIWGWYELRVSNPLVDLRVSARPAILFTNFASVAMGFALFSSNVAFPQLLQLPEQIGGLGLDLIPASLTLMPAGLAMLAAAPIAGLIERRVGPRPLLVAGALIIAVAYAVCLVVDLNFWIITGINVVIGIGIGLGYAAMPAQIMAAVPQNETAAANGLNAFMRSFGTTVAAAVVGAILSSATPVTIIDSFHEVFVLGLIAALVCALFAFLVPQRKEPEEVADAIAA